ncbi:hypothetical protein [Pseudogemmobacter sonorensis]|uniref:hypothetical protein n=1 Tax=Pseudogemmobacter sonorensis TaxID=2989681 RepID=UPI0036AC962F
MSVLRADPDLFDLGAWRARLAELRAEKPSDHRDAMLEYTENHITMLLTLSPKTAAQAG